MEFPCLVGSWPQKCHFTKIFWFSESLFFDMAMKITYAELKILTFDKRFSKQYSYLILKSPKLHLIFGPPKIDPKNVMFWNWPKSKSKQFCFDEIHKNWSYRQFDPTFGLFIFGELYHSWYSLFLVPVLFAMKHHQLFRTSCSLSVVYLRSK